jgi:hypothetical protein
MTFGTWMILAIAPNVQRFTLFMQAAQISFPSLFPMR